MTDLVVSDVEFTRADRADVASGLLAWVRLTLNSCLRLDGLTIRKTISGHHRLTFPARKDGWGHEHPHIRPLDAETHRRLESAVFAALGIKEIPSL